ncbi:MAG: cob(I)yrinic acid a,c-diamide adenosyltransferase, partial [Novosphingobium sp.]
NSAIGLAVCALSGPSCPDSPHAAVLTRIQNDLFDLGADLATPGEDFTPGEMTLRMVSAQAEWLETAIDAINEDLQPLKSFILPGGSEAAARVHIARAATRHAERKAAALAAAEPVNPAALAYINRLSDYLFVLARAVNANGADDVLWVPGQNR